MPYQFESTKANINEDSEDSKSNVDDDQTSFTGLGIWYILWNRTEGV